MTVPNDSASGDEEESGRRGGGGGAGGLEREKRKGESTLEPLKRQSISLDEVKLETENAENIWSHIWFL